MCEERFVAFDVETPNAANARMSAIGIAVVEKGQVVREFSTLVNPETYFNRFNVALTGITPEMAAKGPTFAQLWPEIKETMGSGLLIAHNAPFDMGVLAKCLKAYGISWKVRTEYACTVRMGRYCCPELPNHRLDTLCTHYGIALEHHRAGSDSRACAELLLHYLDEGAELSRFRRTYDLQLLKTL